MSKAIVIQKNGVDQQISVDRLSTPKVGGGRELWLPEDETTTGSITVTKRGTVIASDLGLYGFHEAVIDVKSVTGKKGGKTYTVSVDTDGYLEYTEDTQAGIPVRIEVVTPPTNPYNVYQDGQTIEKTGMVVKAYDANDVEWGTVPINDITISPTTAVYDASTDEKYTAVAFGNIGGQNVRIPLYNFATYDNSEVNTIREYDYFPLTTAYCVAIAGESGKHPALILASETSGTYMYYSIYRPTGRRTENTGEFISEYTYNGQTVYFGGVMHTQMSLEQARASYDIPVTEYSISRQQIAWLMIYGTITPHQPGSRQQITVSWPRPDDGQVLTTTFDIAVAPPYSDGNEE